METTSLLAKMTFKKLAAKYSMTIDEVEKISHQYGYANIEVTIAKMFETQKMQFSGNSEWANLKAECFAEVMSGNVDKIEFRNR